MRLHNSAILQGDVGKKGTAAGEENKAENEETEVSCGTSFVLAGNALCMGKVMPDL